MQEPSALSEQTSTTCSCAQGTSSYSNSRQRRTLLYSNLGRE